MSNNPRAAVMRPSAATNASKFSDIDVEFHNCHYGEATLNASKDGSYAGGVTFAFIADLLNLDEDAVNPEQLWSIGNVTAWSASDDGLEAIPTKDGGTLKNSCNYFRFLKSLVDHGFPEDRMEDASSFNGLRCHLAEASYTNSDGKTTKTLVCTKILPNGLPWEASKRKGATKKASKTVETTAPAPASSPAHSTTEIPGDLKVLITMAVTAAVTAAGGTLERKKITQAIMKVVQAPANKDVYPASSRSAIIAAATHDDVLNSLDGISYDGAILSLE